MKYSTTFLPLVASATAFVVPDEATAKQLILETEQHAEKTVSSWWDSALPTFEDILSSAEETFETALGSLEKQASKLNDLLPSIKIESELDDFLAPSDYTSNGGVDETGSGKSTNLTVYQSIHASNYTKKFAHLVDDFPDIVEKLNSTSANVTLFVPTDHAFEKIPKHIREHKPPKEFVEKFLQYHVVPGFYPAGRVLTHHTLPTAWKEEALGGRPQRLRVSVSLFGVKLNFYSKVIYANLITKNGVVHGVDSILVPPPPIKKLVSLFPGKFSTLELAAKKSGFAHHDTSDNTSSPLTGLTLFAPTNTAFKKLGPGANAFLFNTEKGLHYLKALLAYHVVVNETLYSDEYYGKKSTTSTSTFSVSEGEESEEGKGKPNGHFHLDLPTLLGDKHLAVDIARWYGFIKIKVNGRVEVAIQDGLAKDGVVQVVDSVLIPPHPRKGGSDWVEGEIMVDELVQRLEPFVGREVEEEAGEL